MRRSHEGLRGVAKDNYLSLTEKVKTSLVPIFFNP